MKLQDPKLGPKKWWGIVKSLYGNKIQSTIPALLDGDRIITDAKEKATIFNQYYITQCKRENNDGRIPNIIDFQNSSFISCLSTTELEVKELLNAVDVSKASGVDGVGNFLIKICADGIARPFSQFINISLSKGIFPSAWKKANVIPSFKKDDRQCKDNCRPISLLISLSKICEKFVYL